MAVNDIRSNLSVRLALASVAISTNTTTTGSAIDTSGHELGLMFAVDVSAYTDGTYTLSIETADDSGFSVNLEEIVTGDANFLEGADGVALTAVTAVGAKCLTVGAFGNRKFARIKIVSTAVTTGATVSARVVQAAEYSPVD
tara:strand:- start:16524 stop:16949 length:426 start_codon:yes stop_codon:yes gene_type:complete